MSTDNHEHGVPQAAPINIQLYYSAQLVTGETIFSHVLTSIFVNCAGLPQMMLSDRLLHLICGTQIYTKHKLQLCIRLELLNAKFLGHLT